MIKLKSQSALEFVLALSIIGFLALGALRIGIWFNANYAKRQVSYEKDRLQYGQNATGAKFNEEHLNLTEDWIFKGKSSGEVKKIPSGKKDCIDTNNYCIQKSVKDTRDLLTKVTTEWQRMHDEILPVANYLTGTWCPPCCDLNCCSVCVLIHPCACYYCWLGKVLEEFCKNIKTAIKRVDSEAKGLRDCPSNSSVCL